MAIGLTTGCGGDARCAYGLIHHSQLWCLFGVRKISNMQFGCSNRSCLCPRNGDQTFLDDNKSKLVRAHVHHNHTSMRATDSHQRNYHIPRAGAQGTDGVGITWHLGTLSNDNLTSKALCQDFEFDAYIHHKRPASTAKRLEWTAPS